MKFTVGDRVKIMSAALSEWGVPVGSIGIIQIESGDNGYWVKWNCKTARDDKIWSAENTDLILMPKTPKLKKRSIKK